MTGIDLASITAIDMHAHAERSVRTPTSSALPNHPWPTPTAEDVAVHYRALDMACVVFPVDAEPMLASPPVPNEEVAEIAAANSDVLIPFGSLNPHRGEGLPLRARRLVEEHGIRGFKFHPGLMEFFPNDPLVYPLLEELESLGVPAIFHTGQAAGGGRIRLKYSDPIHLDDVAVDFPGLKIVMAHPSFPWQDVALSIASRREHVYIDLSGWSPKYFPPQLIHYANTLLKDKVMFGSDFPVIAPERWLADFVEAPFRDSVRGGILKGNAARMLGLDAA
ncbi:MAG: amidohydrolase family protein [Microbacterium sp.]